MTPGLPVVTVQAWVAWTSTPAVPPDWPVFSRPHAWRTAGRWASRSPGRSNPARRQHARVGQEDRQGVGDGQAVELDVIQAGDARQRRAERGAGDVR